MKINIISVGYSLAENYHYEPKRWYNVLPHIAIGPLYTSPSA